jgi:hypothetical protein
MAGLGFILLTMVVLLLTLVIGSTLDRPIEQALRNRWPTFHYDGQIVLVWGVAALGGLTMLVFVMLALGRF